jgi:hypothetical protein
MNGFQGQCSFCERKHERTEEENVKMETEQTSSVQLSV